MRKTSRFIVVLLAILPWLNVHAFEFHTNTLPSVLADMEKTFKSEATGDVDSLAKFKKPYRIKKDVDIAQLNALISSGSVSLYSMPIVSTPVFYRSDISTIFGGGEATGGLLLDDYGQVDPLEFVAFRGTVMKVVSVLKDKDHLVYQITTPAYPYPTESGYFVDSRMVQLFIAPYGKLDEAYAKDRSHLALPKEDQILEKMKSLSGAMYVWWGNEPKGMSKLVSLYRPNVQLSEEFMKKWKLQGVDCSGLLFYATNGLTPRNTSSLVKFWTGMTLSGKSLEEVVSVLKPLDLIAWKGHTLIVLDDTHVIESNLSLGGVVISDTRTRLAEIMEKRVGVDSIDDVLPDGKKPFVIRRWYHE